MNMKKAQWLKKSSNFLKRDLHTVEFINDDKSSVFFTLGESGTIKMTAESPSCSISFIFFHTPNDYIVFKDGKIESSFFGLKSIHNMFKPLSELEINKEGEEITFSSQNVELLRIKNEAFFSSSSFGITAEGNGLVKLSVW